MTFERQPSSKGELGTDDVVETKIVSPGSDGVSDPHCFASSLMWTGLELSSSLATAMEGELIGRSRFDTH